MGLISKEQAEILVKKIKEITRINELGVRYVDMKYVEAIISDCEYAPSVSESKYANPVNDNPHVIDEQYQAMLDAEAPLIAQVRELFNRTDRIERNLFTLDDNHIKLRDGSDNDFSIVHQRIDKLQKNQDRLDHWLHALERSIMGLKGANLGRLAGNLFDKRKGDV